VNAVAMPDGGAMLFIVNGTVIDGKPAARTEVLRIDRSGSLHAIVDIGDGMSYGNGRLEAQFWWDRSQNLCFFSRGGARDTLLLYARLDVHKGNPVVLSTRTWYYPREWFSVQVRNRSYPNRMRQVLKRAPSAHDYLLRLCYSWAKAAGTEIAPDTLLFVDGPAPRSIHSDTSRSALSATEALFVCRVRAVDLGLIDSISVPTSAVEGVDYDGAPLLQAYLISDTGGFQFVVPMVDGNVGYRFDRRGRPVMGARSPGTVLEATAGKLKNYQVLPFRTLRIESDRRVDWFGFTDQGQPCHVSAENRQR